MGRGVQRGRAHGEAAREALLRQRRGEVNGQHPEKVRGQRERPLVKAHGVHEEEQRRAGEHGDKAPERAHGQIARAQFFHLPAREQAQKAMGEGDGAEAGKQAR